MTATSLADRIRLERRSGFVGAGGGARALGQRVRGAWTADDLGGRPRRDGDELLQHVWDQSFGGSNVVDAVVKSLRRKLGPLGSALETVIGHGYRFTGFPRRPAQTAH